MYGTPYYGQPPIQPVQPVIQPVQPVYVVPQPVYAPPPMAYLPPPPPPRYGGQRYVYRRGLFF